MDIKVLTFILITLCVVLAVAVSFFFYISYKSVMLNRQYEDFYAQSVDEISSVLDSLNTIIKKRQILSDDADVQNLIRGMTIARDIIENYSSIRITTPTTKSPS